MDYKFVDICGNVQTFKQFVAITNRVQLILQCMPEVELYLMNRTYQDDTTSNALIQNVPVREDEIILLAKSWKTDGKGSRITFNAPSYNEYNNLHFSGECAYTSSTIMHGLTVIANSFPETPITVIWFRHNKDVEDYMIKYETESWRNMEGGPIEYDRLSLSSKAIIDSLRLFTLNFLNNQRIAVGGVNSDGQVILYVPSSNYSLSEINLASLFSNINVEFKDHYDNDWAHIYAASKAQIDLIAFHYPNHRFVVYGIYYKKFYGYANTANKMLFRETFINQFTEKFKPLTSKSLF